MKEIAILFFSVVLQNASFTLVSRARNSKSLWYHGIASVLSNGLWLIVIRQVVVALDDWWMYATYLVGAVSGSVLMHWIAMRFFEKRVADFHQAWREQQINVQPHKLKAQFTVETEQLEAHLIGDKIKIEVGDWVESNGNEVVDNYLKGKAHRVSKVVRDSVYIEGFGDDLVFYGPVLMVVRKASLWTKLKRYVGDYFSGRKWD